MHLFFCVWSFCRFLTKIFPVKKQWTNVSRRGKKDLKSEKGNGSKTRLYQIVNTTESVFNS